MVNLFFDLDGTLLDSQEGIVQSIQFALDELDQDKLHADELTWMIGPPLLNGFYTLLQDEELAMQAVEAYRKNYDAGEGMYLADPYDGIGEMLAEFETWGARLYVATSKPQHTAQKMVEHFGLDAYVQDVFGSLPDGSRSDKSELLQFVLEETGADPSLSVMIGDRRHDIIGAKNNDMFNIGALWGFGDAQELREIEADMLAGHPEELPEIVADLLALEIK